MAIVNNAVKAMEAAMTPEQIHRAHALAEREILVIRLAELRERLGLKQTDVSAFSQTAVSKLERRKDMKISTLIDYLECLGMGLELRVYPKNEQNSQNTEILLRI